MRHQQVPLHIFNRDNPLIVSTPFFPNKAYNLLFTLESRKRGKPLQCFDAVMMTIIGFFSSLLWMSGC